MEPLANATRTPTRKAKKNQPQQSQRQSVTTAATDANGNSGEKSELALFGEGLRRRRRDTSGREYDEVDDRITIPLASISRGVTGINNAAALHNHKIGVSVSTSASSSGVGGEKKSESILQTGLSKYRSLSGKTQQQSSKAPLASSSTVAMSTATSSTVTTTTTAAASTTSSPTIIIPGASLNVRMEDSSRVMMPQLQRNAFFSASSSRNQQQQYNNNNSTSNMNNRSSMTPSTRQQQYLHNTGSGGVLPDLSPLDHATRLMNQKQYAAAIPFFTDALSSSSSYSNSSPMQQQSKVRIYHDRGNCFLMAQRYSQAIEDFTRVMSMAPKNAQLFARRAKAYAHVNQHQAALSDYNEAINIAAAPSAYASVNRAELRGLYLARSRVYSAMNRVHDALDDLAKAESTGGDRDAELYYQRASLHLKRNQNVLALKDFDRFLELHSELPHQDVDNVNGGTNGSSGTNAGSEAQERMAEVLFDRAKLLQQLAAEEDAQQRKDTALSAFEQGGSFTSDKNARRPTGYRSAEAIALELRAIKDYTLLLGGDPSNTETLRRRGEAYGHIEWYEDAFKDFDLAHGLDPHDFEVSLARARVYHQQNKLEKAIDEITTVLKVNGFFVDALFFRARLYEQVGDVLKAQRDYTSVIEAHYDLRGESYSDAGNPTSATEKTPLLSKAGNNSSNSNSKSNARSPQAVVKPAKITSEYSLRALMQRARLSVQIDKFDEAIADYERILISDANNVDAQVELPGVRKKKSEYEEKVHRDAVAWLEKEAREKQLETGGDGGGGSATAPKKKKKKKTKKKKRPTQTDYVLLEDDEDDESSTITITIADGGNADAAAGGGGGEQDKENGGNAQTEEQGAVVDAVAAATGKPEPDLEQPVQDESSAGKKAAESASVAAVPPARAVSASVTRDEACESMWEQSDDQTDSAEDVSESRRGKRDSGGGGKRSVDAGVAVFKQQSAESDDEQPAKTKPEATASRQQDEDENAEDREEEDKEGSATDSSSNAAPREVIVDEKYLRKRQRQLENLRADFLQVCEARDKAGIEEVLERAERKQMTESLSDEIDRAKAVLEGIESGEGVEEAVVADVSVAGEATVTEEPEPVQPTAIATAAEPAVIPVEKQDQKAIVPVESAPVAAPQQKRSHRHSQTIVTQSTDSDPLAVPNGSGSKLASLVIRPIAYGQALQLAEQSQNLFLQNQRLLQEKDAEIESLRQLLAQSLRQATIERFDEAVSDELSSKFASLRSQFPHKRLRELKNRVDVLINWMGPNDDADLTRRKILAFVHRVLEAANFALGTPIFVFPTGSFPMKTYLPTADLDVCLLLPKELEQTWYFPVLHALCLAGSSSNPADGGSGSLNGSPNPKLSGTPGGSAGAVGGATATGLNSYTSSIATNTVRNVNFINADVRVIKCTIDNISVDFTANRVGALGALLLLDSMDARVGFEHLLKKSLILIKAWCIHESSAYTAAPHGSPSQPQTTGASASSPAGHSVLGASYGAFSTYAINTVVMGLFNQYGSSITHPLQALFLFLDRMTEFPWHEAAMTLHGAVALSALASSSSLSNAMKKKMKSQNGRNGGGGIELHSAKMSVDDVEGIRLRMQEQFGAFDASSSTPNGFKVSMFPIRVCNIVDPLDEKNNLARSVSVDWFPSMKRAFRLGRNRLGQLLSSSSGGQSSPLGEMDDFFVNSWRSYGRGDGWRPDLLVHPRQVWHGKPGGTSVAPNGEQNDDLRWQSLLPEFVPMAGPSLYQPQGAMYQQQSQQQYVSHHHQQHMQHQSPHHHQHQHHHQQQQQYHMSSSGVPVASEPIPYQQHRRSFDSKSSPLKSVTTVRQQSSPLPAGGSGMAYSGGGPGAHAQGKSSARRAYDSPSSYVPK
ncbi:DNA polymerase sigma [Globisporangium polare]